MKKRLGQLGSWGGGEGGVRKLLFWFMVLCCGVDIAVFSSPPRAKAEPVKRENGGELGEEQKAEKVFSFSFSPRQYFVLCHLGITPSTTPGNSPKWAIQYVCEIKVRIPQANQKNHPYPHPPPPTFKSQMVGP